MEINEFERKAVPGLYSFDHFEHPSGAFIQRSQSQPTYWVFQDADGKRHDRVYSYEELKDIVRVSAPYPVVEVSDEVSYQATQTEDEITDKTVIVTDAGTVGFMMDAWPVAVTLRAGQFHTLERPLSQCGPGVRKHGKAASHAIMEALERGLTIDGKFTS